MKQFDLIIVGAGIMGLAHAYYASRAGLSVLVVERTRFAQGASTRNFGMLALFAQAQGQQMHDAMRALDTWQHIAPLAGFTLYQSGCLVVAQHAEEMAIIEEYLETIDGSSTAKMVNTSRLKHYASSARSDRLLGGLWSSNVWKVDQLQASEKIARWLQTQGVAFLFSTEALLVEPPLVNTTNGSFYCGRAVVCAGDEFSTLFPESFDAVAVERCELQMFRTFPQPREWALKPFVLGGLSLSRYSAFANCASMSDLKSMQQESYATYLDYGIHIIACQELDGSITIGDSHNDSSNITIDQANEIERLILRELDALIDIPNRDIQHRWRGHYAQLTGTDVLKIEPTNNVVAVTMTNGQGMTHAFAIAHDIVREITH